LKLKNKNTYTKSNLQEKKKGPYLSLIFYHIFIDH